ncbi:MAG: DUF494 family protein, partial [Gemmatimonadetes bacterium]|nr:DUF494 family protein [Gemmatimonadota bacterium]
MEEEPDQGALESELVEAGFAQPKVKKAFTWLETLAEQQASDSPARALRPAQASARIYTDDERHKLSRDARGF